MNKNKYGAKKAKYKDRIYDSTLECNYAQQLDWRKKAGEIKRWESQYKLELKINDRHICNYYVDFLVELFDGKVEYHEVKGFETSLWRLKWKMVKAIYCNNDFILIKKL